jgi:dUTP pyrophosphatase
VGAGIIDSDYRGGISVLLFNHSDAPVTIEAGSRIAQIIISPCSSRPFCEADELDKTFRGAAGFGSTGMSEDSQAGAAPEGPPLP